MLDEILSPRRVFLDLRPAPKPELLRAIVLRLAETGEIEAVEPIADLLIKREEMMTTGVKRGLAFPHAFTPDVGALGLTIARIPDGTDYQSLDNAPVEFVFLLLGPPQRQDLHLRMLARISRITAESGMLDALREMTTPEAAIELLREAERRVALRF